jgi:hypothetical protein
VQLDDDNDVSVGATATVLDCNLGYKLNKDKISCLGTGEWDESGCVLLGKIWFLFPTSIFYSSYLVSIIWNYISSKLIRTCNLWHRKSWVRVNPLFRNVFETKNQDKRVCKFEGYIFPYSIYIMNLFFTIIIIYNHYSK